VKRLGKECAIVSSHANSTNRNKKRPSYPRQSHLVDIYVLCISFYSHERVMSSHVLTRNIRYKSGFSEQIRGFSMVDIIYRQFTPRDGQNWSLHQLPVLSDDHCQQLNQANIHTVWDLLQHSRTPEAQTKLAQGLHLHLHHVQKWRALADLARIPNVGPQYCGLLLHAGVPSAQNLANLQAGRLHRQIMKLQITAMRRADLCPSVAMVADWIQQAKRLPTI
jgi:hypothetical protein